MIIKSGEETLPNISAKYEPLWTGKYRYAIVSGGRGSGKSYAINSFLPCLGYEKGHKVLMTRYTMRTSEDSIIPEFIEKLNIIPSPYNKNKPMIADFNVTDDYIVNKVTGVAYMFRGIRTSSGNQTAALKSLQGITTWFLEEAEELPDDEAKRGTATFDTIDDSIRQKGCQLRTILSWNPTDESAFIFKRFFKERGVPITHNGIVGDVLYIYTTYLDNIDNLNQATLDKIELTRKNNPMRYNHVYLGLPIVENANALWNMSKMIEPYRVNEYPAMKRIVVGVDPSVTSTGKQDECGIVVAGLGIDGHYYVMADCSDVFTPAQWGNEVIKAYRMFDADKIIAEVNQGGDLVEMNIRQVDKSAPVKKVRASRGKIVRAEPIAALYEQGKVHHVGHFGDLESEMCSYCGYDNEESPDRLDALCWALTELSGQQKTFVFGN